LIIFIVIPKAVGISTLKKQIRAARINVPISGTENAINIAHIQATRSSSGNDVTNCLSLPCNNLR